MPCRQSLIICLSIIALLFLSSVHSNSNNLVEDQNDQALPTILNSMKIFLNANDADEQLLILNQLREYLNRMCIHGYFGLANGRACQAIVENLSQTTNHAEHDRHKRFFCNGFIGCKSVAGR